MRYFKSWIFDVGLALVLAAVAATYLVQPQRHDVPAVGSDIGFRESYTDYDLRLPAGLAFSGLTVIVIATTRLKSRSSN